MTTPFNKRNFFDLTHDRLLTLDMGQLVPADIVEVLPGDTFTIDTRVFSRLEAMIAPALVDVDLLVYHFFVPARILMEDKDWESFITGGFDGKSTVVSPYMMSPSGGYEVCSLADYLGIRPGISNIKHSAFPFRAYAKIYNEYFRDENLISEVALSTADGLDETTNTTLLNKCWEKDYFTSALPWPQRGDAATLPLSDSAPVGINSPVSNVNDPVSVKDLTTGGNLFLHKQGDYDNIYPSTGGKSNFLVADLASATPVTINALRVAFQVQRFLERQARGGARLVETILSHFGVRIPDARIQRPEYIGGSRLRYMVSPVEQTSATDATSPQGNLAGRGTLNAGARTVTKSFVEHGYMMTLVCVMPRTLYSQGLHRMWSRDSRYDYYWPVFAHLGEQEVRNKEIYAQGTADDDGIFGYNDRAAEYRHIPSTVAGLFRPDQSLEFWTLARKFDSLPQLSDKFVTADPSQRIFAVQTGETSANHIIMQFRNVIKSWRCIPKYGNPGLIDHD